jgi:hypothetical protein
MLRSFTYKRRSQSRGAHLDQQVPLLVLQRGAHQQRQDLVEQRARAKVARLVCRAGTPAGEVLSLGLWITLTVHAAAAASHSSG